MPIVDAQGNELKSGKELRVVNGPLAGTILHERLPEGRFGRIPITDDDGRTMWLMFEKDVSGLRFRGWSFDGAEIDAAFDTPQCRRITDEWLNMCRAWGIEFKARCLQRPDKVKPIKPSDIAPYSDDDLYGEDEIKDWTPPEAE